MYLAMCLCLAFALLLSTYAAASLLMAALWPWLNRLSFEWSPKRRADFLFALQIFPGAASILLAVFCAAAFLMFEPQETGERISVKLAAAAVLAACGMALSLRRAALSWVESRRLIAGWMRGAEPVSFPGTAIVAYRFEHPYPLLAVTGILRPRLFVSHSVLAAMRPEEMTAAVAHEIGHVAARDNLRRLLLRLCPGFRREAGKVWEEAAEAAADVYAVRHRSVFALDLASALITAARLTPPDMPMPILACALSPLLPAGLAGRIERLMALDPVVMDSPTPWSRYVVGLVLLAGILTSPVCLRATYDLLEKLIRLLS